MKEVNSMVLSGLDLNTINKSGRKTKNVDLFYTEVLTNWTRQFENLANLKRADISLQTRNNMVYVNLVNRGNKPSKGSISIGFSLNRYHEDKLGFRFRGFEATHAVSAKDWQFLMQSVVDDAIDMFESFNLPTEISIESTSFFVNCDYTTLGLEKAYRQIEIVRELLLDGDYVNILNRLKDGESIDQIMQTSCQIQESDYQTIDQELHLAFCTTHSYGAVDRTLTCDERNAKKKEALSKAWTNKRAIVKRIESALKSNRVVIAHPVASRYIDQAYEVLGYYKNEDGLIELELGQPIQSDKINKRYVFERRQRFEILNESKIY